MVRFCQSVVSHIFKYCFIYCNLNHYVSLCDISFIESFNRSSKAYGHVLLGEYSKSCYIKKSSDSFNLLVFLAGLILPVIGCAIGVVCLCFKECRASRPALACAILAVALPVAALLLTILLFSTGVWVISLM